MTTILRCRPPRPVAGLELSGELPHWSEAIALRPVAGGRFEATLDLAPGVYAYKLRAPDGGWMLDADNPRTIAGGAGGAGGEGGDVDSVLVIGGTPEPVLHAPAAPWLWRRDDGRLVVRAAVRRDAAGRGAPAVRCGDGERPMRAVAGDALHVGYEAELPGAARTIEYGFALPDGRLVAGADGALLRASLDALDDAARRPPAWWRGAVVYTIFIDRFRRAGGAWPAGAGWAREVTCGGDLDGVREALPYLVDLGVTVLHLTPVTPAPSVHRYDAIDPRAVAPEVGGEAAWDRLIDAAHAAGLRVLADVVTTHVDRGFAPFGDVAARGPASPYWPWFRGHRWPFFAGPDPGYEHYQKGRWQEPLVALDEPAVVEWLEGTVQHWLRRGADGVRLDAAADVPLAVLARLRAAARAVRRDAIVIGEVVPSRLERWTPGALDAATDFAAQGALVGWLTGELPTAEVAAGEAARRLRRAHGHAALAFTGTHDQARVRTRTGDAARARLGLVRVALGAAVPLLYYGDEVGLRADDAGAVAREFEDSWPDRQPMPWPAGAADVADARWDRDTHDLLRAALALRARRAVLRDGDEHVTAAGDDALIVRRAAGAAAPDDAIDVVLHRGATPATVALPPGAAATVLLAHGGATLDATGEAVTLPPGALIVVDRRPPAPTANADAGPDADEAIALRVHNAALARAAWRDAQVLTPAFPTRLIVTVTEACNLRCAHCITDAPARTRSGRARQLPAWAIAALAEAFAHVDHVAFTHGGESVTAPRFPEVLRAIAAARAGRPGRAEVHLASNGMLLDAARLRELVDLGLTSLMISVDGATAATNDRIRVLGRIDRTLDHVAAAVALRDGGADLRVGLSCVIGRTNVAEITALARRAALLGVDWLKLEETYPATSFARHDRLAPEDAAVRDAVAGARAALDGSRVVMVDHVDPPAGCPCQHADPATRARAAAFRAADDFAHRATLAPCRSAWEQAFVDADGTVRAVDHAGPVLGSLLDAPLLALWNAPPALALRSRALAGTTAEQRASCG